MAFNSAHQKYKTAQVNTANQGKLIVMLYDGAIRFINQALELMKKNQIEETHKNIVKAHDILTELVTSLNMDAGEISQQLFSLYMYMQNKLTEANVKKDPAPLEEVKKYLTELKSAWEEACKKAPQQTTGPGGGINIAT